MQGDVRERLAEIPEKSVQTCITSPPYWGLRDYGLPPSVWGGDKDCAHEWVIERTARPNSSGGKASENNPYAKKLAIKGTENYSEYADYHDRATYSQFCQKCGAWLGCLGLEPTPEMFVQNMVEVFRGVWRVLRDDGTVWLNLGDSYAGGGRMSGVNIDSEVFKNSKQNTNRGVFGTTKFPIPEGVKPKDLVGIPWFVAFALRADGWYLRSDIIWHKPNPMPESVRDRPTKSHEYIFLLTKNKQYYYDAEAIREPNSENSGKWGKMVPTKTAKAQGKHGATSALTNTMSKDECIEKYYTHGRNKRSVWKVATQPYREAHFAVFPEKLIEPCILAGSSPKACEVCGSPWERVVERGEALDEWRKSCGADSDGGYQGRAQKDYVNAKAQDASATKARILAGMVEKKTTGWQPTCPCPNEGKGKSIVLDPFAGSGTTLWVAEQHGRDGIGIELSPEYCDLIFKRMDKMQGTIFGLGVSE